VHEWLSAHLSSYKNITKNRLSKASIATSQE
jgi:hypothetical protein